MSRFGNEYNPHGRDRSRFETQGEFEERCAKDRIAAEEQAERERRERKDALDSHA